MILALVEASLITPLNVTSIVFAETTIPFSGSFEGVIIEDNEETGIFQDEGNHSIFMELELQKANIQSHLIKPDRDVMHTIQYTISDNNGNSITFELMET